MRAKSWLRYSSASWRVGGAESVLYLGQGGRVEEDVAQGDGPRHRLEHHGGVRPGRAERGQEGQQGRPAPVAAAHRGVAAVEALEAGAELRQEVVAEAEEAHLLGLLPPGEHPLADVVHHPHLGHRPVVEPPQRLALAEEGDEGGEAAQDEGQGQGRLEGQEHGQHGGQGERPPQEPGQGVDGGDGPVPGFVLGPQEEVVEARALEEGQVVQAVGLGQDAPGNVPRQVV
ncbi:MAG TPA: hypothetical protein VHN78_09715, partial [Chloroflexota bacterium]|nr:hypothetical protein [Chloroflexota bacterium]